MVLWTSPKLTNPPTPTHMSDSINPQTPNNMDHVPTSNDYITAAQQQVATIYTATLKAMRDLDEAKASQPAPSAPAALDEEKLKRLIALTWKEAIEFANMHVEDEVCKEITVQAYIDERVYDNLDISIRGEVETEVNLGDVLDIEIPERFDGVEQTHDQILQGFLEQENKEPEPEPEPEPTPPTPETDTVSHVADPHNQLTGVKVVGSIDLSKNNA